MFETDLADAVEEGDLFFCQECHEVTDGEYCPSCHVGRCELCTIPVVLENLGWRDFIEPAIMFCRDCAAHEEGIATHQPPALSHIEKCALALLR